MAFGTRLLPVSGAILVAAAVLMSVLIPMALAQQQANGGKAPDKSIDKPADNSQGMEFADKPNFAVAGVTDWTAVGGHGSDSSLRTSEALAREALTLKAGGFRRRLSQGTNRKAGCVQILPALPAVLQPTISSARSICRPADIGSRFRCCRPPTRSTRPTMAMSTIWPWPSKQAGDFSQARDHVQKLLAQQDNADLHRLLGELDEKMGDPLAAVHEDEQAVRLDPSEENYFAWGSELLLHRAVWQAAEVFRNGAKAYPKSARMLAALGTALFAGALYDEAAASLCSASDLNPADPEPYIFMGRIEMAAPKPLACVEPRLARFVQQQPANSLANYFYAMAIWKRQQQPPDQQARQQVETLLTKAVAIDPKCGDAYLQLGILSFLPTRS